MGSDLSTRIYHGTRGSNIPSILRDGIIPMGKTNWPEFPSAPGFVYLTSVYAPYFAGCVSDDEPWGIVEIDLGKLDTENLYPDEDFIEQATRGSGVHGAPGGIKDRTEFFRDKILEYRSSWPASLQFMGVCSYRGTIPAKAITRSSIFNPETNPIISLLSMDPTITLMNYSVCSGKYSEITKWFMGGKVDPSLLFGGSDYMAIEKYSVLRMKDGLTHT